MTLHTAGLARGILEFGVIAALMCLHKRVQAVLGNDLAVGPEVTAVVELVDFDRVASGANAGGHKHRDISISADQIFVLGSGWITGIDFVAVNTRNACVSVAAVLPIVDDSGLFEAVCSGVWGRPRRAWTLPASPGFPRPA